MNLNPNCDGNHCEYATGETRVLPTGPKSNAILCQQCFNWELKWRATRNRDLAKDCAFKLPEWLSLALSHPAAGTSFTKDHFSGMLNVNAE
jgi:hypothetical protein